MSAAVCCPRSSTRYANNVRDEMLRERFLRVGLDEHDVLEHFPADRIKPAADTRCQGAAACKPAQQRPNALAGRASVRLTEQRPAGRLARHEHSQSIRHDDDVEAGSRWQRRGDLDEWDANLDILTNGVMRHSAVELRWIAKAR